MPLTAADREIINFTISCRMSRRWARQLCAMLRYMQYLGGVGSSRTVSIIADGDGDFRPEFHFTDAPDFAPVQPRSDHDGNHTYDAG